MTNNKEEFITIAYYIDQPFSPPDSSYKFVSSQIISHDGFKPDTYIYVTWKKTPTARKFNYAHPENPQQSFWDDIVMADESEEGI